MSGLSILLDSNARRKDTNSSSKKFRKISKNSTKPTSLWNDPIFSIYFTKQSSDHFLNSMFGIWSPNIKFTFDVRASVAR